MVIFIENIEIHTELIKQQMYYAIMNNLKYFSKTCQIPYSIGRFGKYQAWMTFLILIGRMPAVFQMNNVVFILPSVDYICLDKSANNTTNYCPCQNPEYDRSTIVSSVTSEWNLICESKHLASLAQSILQVGILVGSLVFGYVSDRYGRKISTIVALFTNAVFSAISGIVPQFWMFLVCRLLIGVSCGGSALCCYVLFVELYGKTFRSYIIAFYETGYIFGCIMVPVIAYFVRDWRNFQLVTSVPWLLVICYIWVIKESPRWLITVGKKKQAIEILTYIARKNGRAEDIIENNVNKSNDQTQEIQKHGNYLDLFKTPKIALYTIISAMLWISSTHTYYGITQYIGRLQGNIYLNVILSAISLIPATVLVILSNSFFTRQTTIMSTFALAGLSYLLLTIVPSYMTWVSLTFAITGFMGSSSCFTQLYLFTSEIFPTIVRNSAIGFSSVCGRFGGFASPFVVNLETKWITFLIFSVIALIAGLLCYFLPETKNIVLPNTVDQIQHTKTKNNAIDLTE